MDKLLVANRGEIAIRVLRAAGELGIATVAVHSEDDGRSLHTRVADESRVLRGTGAAAYLDAEQIAAIAVACGCDAVHPGYGFLSENAAFAQLCAERGLIFVGPRPATLELFGDKVRAREFAERAGVSVLPGTGGPTSVGEARAFFASLGPGAAMVIKAVAGGGGRGMRVIRNASEIAEAHARCSSEAGAAFGNGDLYVEGLVARARHVEVQIVGDGTGAVSHLGERECSLQRRHQKLVEIAPAPGLAAALRDSLTAAALRLAGDARYRSLGTFEFLIDVAASAGELSAAAPFAFIEANPRLQVEHTVTEAVTGVDLVQAQLKLAEGRSLAEVGLQQDDVPEPRGYAIELRINMETLRPDGAVLPSGGTLATFEVPSGPGIRVDSFGYAGYTTSRRFDSLLAKLIAWSPSPDFADAAKRAYRALREFKLEGVRTNLAFLQGLVQHPEVRAGRVTTSFVDEHVAELVAAAADSHRPLFFESPEDSGADGAEASLRGDSAEAAKRAGGGRVGAAVDPGNPLAVLEHGKAPQPAAAPRRPDPVAPPAADTLAVPGATAVAAPVQGTVVSVAIAPDDAVPAGGQLLVLEAMKMEHVITAPLAGVVRKVTVAPGDTVFEGHPLVWIEAGDVDVDANALAEAPPLDHVRPDLQEVQARHAVGLDAARPDAVARRRKTGQRTARENVADLCDPDSFVEYGALVIAAQRRRRTEEDLIARTPADGLVAGIGCVNGALFGEEAARCVLMSYDYTVLAGTQGAQNHRKKDRMFELAERWKLPLVFFTEGGGGRPGDTDGLGVAGLDCLAFHYFGRLSGLVPLVGITSGRCFAGNAALLGCCDVVIATHGSNIGMGGPAMVEGGGLGVFRPEEIGPLDVQVKNGVVDIAVLDEAEAVDVARRYLAYFQGPTPEWECADQRLLRHAIPENRLRIYDVRSVIEILADTGSMLELRRDFGLGMLTALARVEGRPIGIVANNPSFLAGAIDSDGADKAARFMQLCDAFDIPLLFLCDTPGIMVGPEVEKTALVRHAARMFVTGASVSVPFFTIVLRKGYGLGAQAMAGGSFKAPVFTAAWPTGEFGGMGLEGAVKLGFRKELAAVEDPVERMALYEEMVERMYRHGKAVNMASHFEIDGVIDPQESRRWILRALRSVPPPTPRTGKKRPCIDTW
jgi:acetyl/propionyl-CoA carboxylase alpha subunit/acetyl-CoA carboxylase carboxyltransferase component